MRGLTRSDTKDNISFRPEPILPNYFFPRQADLPFNSGSHYPQRAAPLGESDPGRQ